MSKRKLSELIIMLSIAAVLISQVPSLAVAHGVSNQPATSSHVGSSMDQAEADSQPAAVDDAPTGDSAGETDNGLPEGLINLGGVRCGGAMVNTAC